LKAPCDVGQYRNFNKRERCVSGEKMNKNSIIAIAEGLKQIEDGVERIQRVMREENIKSIKEVAAELIPMLKADDDEINESIIEHLEKRG
jgi:hypothetical protein